MKKTVLRPPLPFQETVVNDGKIGYTKGDGRTVKWRYGGERMKKILPIGNDQPILTSYSEVFCRTDRQCVVYRAGS